MGDGPKFGVWAKSPEDPEVWEGRGSVGNGGDGGRGGDGGDGGEIREMRGESVERFSAAGSL